MIGKTSKGHENETNGRGIGIQTLLAKPGKSRLLQSGNTIFSVVFIFFLAVALLMPATSVFAQSSSQSSSQAIDSKDTFTFDEVLNTGHTFFGNVSGGLASVIEQAFSRFGLPNGYILGEQAGGAFIGGLAYGEGVLHTKTAGQYKAYWQGPTIGWDFGGSGTRTMMLVYQLPDVESLYKRFPGVNGSALFIAGFEMSVRKHGSTLIVPIQSGVGARLGINVGYLKFTTKATINPF